MSKSLDNDIPISFSAEETTKRVMTAVTDSARQFRKDPGHPDICNVYRLHRYFSPEETDTISEKCRSAQIGCVECKRLLAERINAALAPFREKRAAIAANPDDVRQVLAEGAERARVIARETIREVRQNMHLTE